MAYAALITGIAYLTAAVGEQLLWIWRAPRRVAWLSALVVAVTVPLVIPLWRGTTPPAPIAALSPAPLSRRLTVPHSREVFPVREISKSESQHRVASFARGVLLRAESEALTIWLAASALLLLAAVISYARLDRQSAAWPEADIDGTRVVVSPGSGPAVFGFWRQRIVIPSWALSLDARARMLMLRHEREHLRAHDPRWLLVALIAGLLFPWNAALWLIVRRLRLAIELDCDQRVLREDADAQAYGSLLLAVTARRNGEMAFAVALAERSSILERRIRAMTAVTPRRRLLVSIPLLFAVASLTVAAAGTPIPRPPSLGLHGFAATAAVVIPTNATVAQGTNNRVPAPDAARAARRLPPLASPESLPRISVTWENASIKDVLEAFARFTHRSITSAPTVDVPITASIVDQPWLQALQQIMTRHGLRLEVKPDSSIYISPRESDPRPRESSRSAQMSRMVSGTVADAQTGRPITNARINVAGVQLAGEPNETWSTDRGHFALRVPDGEVWLDASARGYELARVTLAGTDNIAVFRGRRTGECLPDTEYSADSARVPEARRQIVPIYSAVFVRQGVPLTRPDSGRPELLCETKGHRAGAVQIKIF